VRGKHNKLGEGERKVRLGQDSLPNIAISVAETSGYYIRCFTRTRSIVANEKLYSTGPWLRKKLKGQQVSCWNMFSGAAEITVLRD
jgi:hypothetical protein